MSDQHQREKAHIPWVWPFASILPKGWWRVRLTEWRDSGSCIIMGTGRGIFPLETAGPRFSPAAPVIFAVMRSPWATNIVSCGHLLHFPLPVYQNAPLLLLGSWFTMRPACPSSNCMIGHKQNKAFAGEREWHAASDFSCQLMGICWVPSRSNEIRKKMQCVWCAFHLTITYVNRMNKGDISQQILNVSFKIQRQEGFLCCTWRERKCIYWGHVEHCWFSHALILLSCWCS